VVLTQPTLTDGHLSLWPWSYLTSQGNEAGNFLFIQISPTVAGLVRPAQMYARLDRDRFQMRNVRNADAGGLVPWPS
jgi:hypothetical protein